VQGCIRCRDRRRCECRGRVRCFGFTLMKREATCPQSNIQFTVSPEDVGYFLLVGQNDERRLQQSGANLRGVSASDTETVRGALG